MKMKVSLTPFAIWWLTRHDQAVIGEYAPESWPEWLQAGYRSMAGRPLQGRLWVARDFPDVEVPWPNPETPLAARLGESAGVESAGGIVVTAEALPLLASFPGILTDLYLKRL